MTIEDEQETETGKRIPWIAILIGAFVVGLILIIVGFILWQVSHPPKEREFFPSTKGQQEAGGYRPSRFEADAPDNPS